MEEEGEEDEGEYVTIFDLNIIGSGGEAWRTCNLIIIEREIMMRRHINDIIITLYSIIHHFFLLLQLPQHIMTPISAF